MGISFYPILSTCLQEQTDGAGNNADEGSTELSTRAPFLARGSRLLASWAPTGRATGAAG